MKSTEHDLIGTESYHKYTCISLFLQGDRGEPGLPGPPGTITDEHGVNIVGPPGPPVSIKYNKGGFSQRKKNFVYSPIFTKFGMKVGLGTLTTGKILMSGYHGNGC